MKTPPATYAYGVLQIASDAPKPTVPSPNPLPDDVVAVGWDEDTQQWVVSQTLWRGETQLANNNPLVNWKWTP